MKKREFIILAILVCFVLSIQTVTASVELDNSNITVESISIQESLSLNDNDSILSDGEGSFSELNSLIENEQSGSLNLNKNYLFLDSDSSLSDGIIIDKDIIISGNVIIDANNKARIFNIMDGCNVSLNGITFKNAVSSNNGGAIHSDGILTLINCSFIDNIANNGGAVYVGSSSSKMVDVNFMNNTALKDGGAIYWNGVNGSVYDIKSYNNTAKHNGGAIFWMGYNGTVLNSKFYNNRANGENSEYNMSFSLDDVIIVTELPDSPLPNKLYVQKVKMVRSMGLEPIRLVNTTPSK